MSRILVTGGAGFIGSHTVMALVELGYEVRVLDCLDPQVHGTNASFPSFLQRIASCIYGDVCDLSTVQKALKGVDAVYHFAALTGVGQSLYDIRHYVATNCAGTATLLEAILKNDLPISRLVLSSSRAVYGEGSYRCPSHGRVYPSARDRAQLEQGDFNIYCSQCDAPLIPLATEEMRPLMPISIYGWTKKAQEELCQQAVESSDLPVTVLRYFNVYGAGQSLQNPYTGVVSIFYSRLQAGQPIYLYEGGMPGRDFVHVKDVVHANLKALQEDVPTGSCFNVGSGSNISIRDLAESLSHATGCKVPLLDQGEFRVGDIHTCFADLTNSALSLKFKPKIRLQAGLDEFVGWAGSEHCVDRYQQTVEELNKYGFIGRGRLGSKSLKPQG